MYRTNAYAPVIFFNLMFTQKKNLWNNWFLGMKEQCS